MACEIKHWCGFLWGHMLALLFIAVCILSSFSGCCDAKRQKGKTTKEATVDTAFESKYNLVDKSKRYSELTTEAYLTSDSLQRMQIFDYLLTKDSWAAGFPGLNALNEFFKHFGDPTYKGTTEMELVTAAIAETTYVKLKEYCYYRLIHYYLDFSSLETASTYIDSLMVQFPKSKYLDWLHLDEISGAVADLRVVSRARGMSKPERLWKLGLTYLRFEVGSEKWRYHPEGNRIAYAYFDTLTRNYPRSPFTVAAKYAKSFFARSEVEDIEDTRTRDLSIAAEYEGLLKECPRIPVRDEILLNLSVIYIENTDIAFESKGDTTSALAFLRKADRCFKRIDLRYFQHRFVVERGWKWKFDYATKTLAKYRRLFRVTDK